MKKILQKEELKHKKQLKENLEMDEKLKKNLIAEHRKVLVGLLREEGYCCTLLQNKSIVFYGGSPTQEEFDKINYASFLIVRDEEKKNGLEIELFDLIG